MDSGFVIQNAVLSTEECTALIAAVSGRRKCRGRAGVRHLMNDPAVSGIANDDRMIAIARRFLGSNAIAYRATFFEKSDRANWLVVWHQDTALPLEKRFDSIEWGPWSVKQGVVYAHAPSWALARVIALRLHLDEAMALNGPLRVIPGSHKFGVLSDEEVSSTANANSAVECLAPVGAVVAMRPLLLHASSKARVRSLRRVLHIEYADSLDLAEGIRLAIA